jgi:hypothetical protein
MISFNYANDNATQRFLIATPQIAFRGVSQSQDPISFAERCGYPEQNSGT